MFSFRHCWRSFLSDRSGALAVVFGLAAPAIFALGGIAVDFTRISKTRTQMQQAADSGALAGAGSMRIANTSLSTAASVAESQARASASTISKLDVSTTVKTSEVQVDLAADVPTSMMKMFGSTFVHVEAHAKARVVGSTPTCVLVLDPNSADAYDMDQASLSANGCAVYSNSTAPDSISLDKGATIKAGLICSGGGTATKGGGSFIPAAQTDCPARTDPLADRAPPTATTCLATDMKVKVVGVLLPGTYCGGLEISGVVATLLPGTYIIKDGKLKISGGGAVVGSGVSFYFTGNDAVLDVSADGLLDLTAPTFGPLAGILMFEDRAAKLGQKHKIYSRSSANLLGTVYLSRGILEVGLKGGGAVLSSQLAQNSAWTIIVVRKLSLNDKINLVLNTNFSGTTVPPPDSLAPGSQVRLVQ